MGELLEVVVVFAGRVVDVAHLGPRRRRYVIGEGPGVDLPIDGAGLPDPGGFVVLSATRGGFELRPCAGLGGWAEVDGGEVAIAELLAAGRERVGTRRAWIVVGGVELHARVVADERMKLGRRPIDWPIHASVVITAAIALCFAALARATPTLERMPEPEDAPAYVRYFAPPPTKIAETLIEAAPRRPAKPVEVECEPGQAGAVGAEKRTLGHATAAGVGAGRGRSASATRG